MIAQPPLLELQVNHSSESQSVESVQLKEGHEPYPLRRWWQLSRPVIPCVILNNRLDDVDDLRFHLWVSFRREGTLNHLLVHPLLNPLRLTREDIAIERMQVYDWMTERRDRFPLSSSDMAIQLDLIAKEVLSSLVRLGDIEGAELLYDEWASKSSSFDPKTMNILLAWYAREGFATKALQTLNRFVEKGGNPKPNTWEILATAYLKDDNLSEALSCMEKAAAITSASKWRPRPTNVESLLSNFKEKNDTESAERLMSVLRSRGCEENEEYKSLINTYAFADT
ncbi:hypothetical protein GUJ93_ZPchr0004g39787 [Zizania palustris]|uniref:Pentatricopeptide repeat-containing protein n=1 Tax=Zizania palustris TaxID=103762 RepID=A0A8J5VZ42_ZIZPA|nr:hypothetical protein GUJ93_ZPchr0004g39787 [Zizania palustris]